jgi:ketosteroid isomerase-like protein
MDAGRSIEDRLRRLEDIEEIRKLKARYCDYVDLGWELEDPDKKNKLVTTVFSEDIVWEVPTADGLSERFVGREQVLEQYDRAVAPFLFGIHLAMNPIIEVDGDQASGQWPVLVPMTEPDGRAVWCSGKYLEKYVRTDDGWRIAYLRLATAFYTPFDTGWAIAQFPGEGSS